MKIWCIPSCRGAAYLAAANFMARAVILLGNFIDSLFSYEMLLLYGAHLDSHIILFFQAVFMIPVFLLGCLLFIGIEKESFNIVLYPTLMLLFLILLRYGAEIALLIIHWEEHRLDQAPWVIYYCCVDLFFIAVLLFYVYFSLASSPTSGGSMPHHHVIKSPSGNLLILPGKKGTKSDPESQELLEKGKKGNKNKKPPAPPPDEEFQPEPPARPPPSPKFNYALRRNIGQLPPDSPQKALVDQLDQQRKRNSQILLNSQDEEVEGEGKKSDEAKVKSQSLKVYDSEPKRRSLVFETDLDADEPTPEGYSDNASPGGVAPEEVMATVTRVEVEVTAPPPPEEEEEPKKEEAAAEEEEESEWEYEYEDEEEEEAPVVVVTLPKPSPSGDKDDDDGRPGSSTKSFKTTAV